MTLFRQIDAAVQALIRDVAREIILPAFYERIADSLIRVKTDHSIVTQIDYNVQAFLQKELQALLPQSGFLGEEESDYTSSAEENGEWLWIIDPIDGTHNFIEQKPEFGTMVALWHLPTHRPVYGWIYLPVADLMFAGGLEEGVCCNGQPLSDLSAVNPAQILQKKLQDMTGLLNYGSFGAAREAMQQNSRHFRVIGPSGCAAVKFVALFQGQADFAVFGRAKIWDLSAGVAMLQALGGYAGRVTADQSGGMTGLTLQNPKSYAGWMLAVRHSADWPSVQAHLFENIPLPSVS